MAKEKKTKEVVIDIPYGMIVYSDGGCRPTNPGHAGYGLHGYVYSNQPPTKGNGNGTNYLTKEGYVEKSSIKDKSEIEEVKPLFYLNGYGALEGLVTNNVAELAGAITALQYAHQYDVKEVAVYTDSEMVVKGACGWLDHWDKNNWLKADGTPVANQPYWKQLAHNVKTLEEKNVKVEFKWVKGHNKHLGNEIADQLATIGVFKAKEGQVLHEIDKDPAEGYWSKSVEKHPLLSFRCMYFCTLPESIHAGQYYLGNHGKDDDLLGKRMADGHYSYVELTTPDPILEMVRNKQVKLANGNDTIVLARLDKLFEAKTFDRLSNYGEICLYTPYLNKLDLHYIDKEPITKELKPPRLALRAIESVNILKGIFEVYFKGNHHFKETEITDRIYELDKKGNYKLKPEFVSGFSKLKIPVNYGIDKTQNIEVELTLGVDIYERNALKKLEKYNPKFTTVTWMESSEMFRYATIIECNEGSKCIIAGMYSNMRFVFQSES